MSYSRFRTAVIGAVVLVGFSVLGGARTAKAPAVPASETLAVPALAPTPAVSGLMLGAPSAAAGAVPSAGPTAGTAAPTQATSTLPRPAHVVVVVEEDASTHALTGKNAPYLTSLARHGAAFPAAAAHQAGSDALALFAGLTPDAAGDACPHSFTAPNLATELVASGRAFTGFAESMPSDGYTGCGTGRFAREDAPWVAFHNVPSSSNRRFARFPKADFATLPTIAFVVPNRCDGMHSCSIATGDAWLKKNLRAYAAWAKTHHSLLIVTFEQSRDPAPGHGVIVSGQGVKTGTYPQKVSHYSVLRTLTDMYGLACLGRACDASPMTAAFRTAPAAG